MADRLTGAFAGLRITFSARQDAMDRGRVVQRLRNPMACAGWRELL